MGDSSFLSEWFHSMAEEPFFKNEAKFTTWFNKKFKERWWFVHKISDFSPDQKPFDVIAALGFAVYWIELKYTKSKSFKPYYYLRWSSSNKPWGQTAWLRSFSRNGWFSLVIVYSVSLNGYVVINYDTLEENNDYCFILSN